MGGYSRIVRQYERNRIAFELEVKTLILKTWFVQEGKFTAIDICCYMTNLQSKGSESGVQSTEELVEVQKEGWEGKSVWEKKEKENA